MSVHPLAPREATRGPLAGVGVIVTRPARQAGAFAQKLAALDAVPIVYPAIVILPPDDPLPLSRAHAALDRYDLAFFVSASAAEYGAPPSGRWPAALSVYAPGPGTAEALAAVGVFHAQVPATSFDSEGLLALPELADARDKRVIIFRGQGGRELLADVLVARGATVDKISCYRRAAPAGDARGLLEALREHRAHALTLTSTEGADNLLRIAGDEGRALLAKIPTFVPHPRIADRARALGLDVRLTASGDAGLIAGLIEWTRSRTTSDNED